MSKPGNLWRKVHGKIAKKPTNFSWLIDDKLAGSGMPTSVSEIDWIIKQGVRSIVTMTEDSLPEQWVKDVKYLHVPTEDFSAPDMQQIDEAVEFIQTRIVNNEPVMVHCAAGIGRTGTILACYLVKYHKISAKDAIQKVRKERPGSIQSESQEIAIGLYYKFLKK
ncbi:Dual specificity protein phosphatase 23 [Nitrosotalea sinensis]|uniref:Dual specificity protein phosphatase 23 n=1 Tax=Nitrosotalea sinensis TaxID=1499975 RepID=A0A2H1EFN6_9ARCH|nr:dual specificity protein phosphatase 23 [Candidatus Nitrosotalea sinensis]SHO43578.1 Dual specificity protein phosphatase 23 [Candidatus Nitrosotalea sinensis]